jgi:hypothetical protein
MGEYKTMENPADFSPTVALWNINKDPSRLTTFDHDLNLIMFSHKIQNRSKKRFPSAYKRKHDGLPF